MEDELRKRDEIRHLLKRAHRDQHRTDIRGLVRTASRIAALAAEVSLLQGHRGKGESDMEPAEAALDAAEFFKRLGKKHAVMSELDDLETFVRLTVPDPVSRIRLFVSLRAARYLVSTAPPDVLAEAVESAAPVKKDEPVE